MCEMFSLIWPVLGERDHRGASDSCAMQCMRLSDMAYQDTCIIHYSLFAS